MLREHYLMLVVRWLVIVFSSCYFNRADTAATMPNGYAPVHAAAYGGQLEIFDLLLSAGASFSGRHYPISRLVPLHLVSCSCVFLSSIGKPLSNRTTVVMTGF
eukprot:SAG31_NODE_232_length_19710_cov_17.109581_10_plen_103_part_00